MEASVSTQNEGQSVQFWPIGNAASEFGVRTEQTRPVGIWHDFLQSPTDWLIEVISRSQSSGIRRVLQPSLLNALAAFSDRGACDGDGTGETGSRVAWNSPVIFEGET